MSLVSSDNPLARVERAALERRRAEREYRAAMREAHSIGIPFARIGRAAGITRQGARKVAR